MTIQQSVKNIAIIQAHVCIWNQIFAGEGYWKYTQNFRYMTKKCYMEMQHNKGQLTSTIFYGIPNSFPSTSIVRVTNCSWMVEG